MAYEVELKAQITAEEHARIKKYLDQHCVDKGFDEKHDIYLKKLGDSEEFLRLRSSEHKGNILTYKDRRTTNGIEMNRELEVTVSDLDKSLELFEALDFVVSFKKTKFIHLYTQEHIHYELAEVAGLGLFLEIEYVVENEKDMQAVEQAKISIQKALEACGLDKGRIEERSYKELLGYL